MKIKALGAVRTVTGSSFRLEMDNGHKILLDCGLFQGGRQTELRNSNHKVYEPENLSAIVLTHAHMDHSGLVPRLVKMGFKGPIYATRPTCDLLEILWLDAAHIQKQEAIWQSRKNNRQGKNNVEPLYDDEDARSAMKLLKPLNFEEVAEIAPGLIMSFYPAGHILGAASVHFTVKENGHTQRVIFSGDIGRTNQLLMPDPADLPAADTVFMETTYGNRDHKDVLASQDELIAVIQEAYQDGGKVLIPAFAVERTQEILHLLSLAWHDGKIPPNIPIYLDSPLATAASEIYTNYIELFDQKTRDHIKDIGNEAYLPPLKISKDAIDSQKINDVKGCAIIIAGSGMANAGRILHHLKHNLWQDNCHVIFVGFQAEGTTGRRLIEGAQEVKIFRESIKVKAKIHTIGGFSGHAGRSELLHWLEKMYKLNPNVCVNLVHGEESSTLAFKESAQKEFGNINLHIPYWLKYAVLCNEQSSDYEESKEEYKIPDAPKVLYEHVERIKGLLDGAGNFSHDELAQAEQYLEKLEALFLVQQKHDN